MNKERLTIVKAMAVEVVVISDGLDGLKLLKPFTIEDD